MAALNFPGSPTTGDLYTANGSTWEWDGTSWNVVPANVLLENLGDVSVTSATTGDLLQYDGTDWINVELDTVTTGKAIAMAIVFGG